MKKNIEDLTPAEVKDMIKAMQWFLDGDFYSAGDIHYQTGCNMEDCQFMEQQFRQIRELDVK